MPAYDGNIIIYERFSSLRLGFCHLTVYEIAFKIQRDSPQCLLSARLPELTFASWCNKERDVMEITCENDGPEAARELSESILLVKKELSLKIRRKAISSRSAQLVSQACACGGVSNSTASLIEKHNCLKMDPVFLKRGWAWYRILAFQQSDVKNLFDQLEKLGTLKIVYRRALSDSPVKDTFVISSSTLLGELTKKQSFALLTALYRGYYEIPKRVSTDEIAKSLGLPRTTFEEHLRKAESKAMKALMPLLQFSGSRVPADGSNVKSKVDEPIMLKVKQ